MKRHLLGVLLYILLGVACIAGIYAIRVLTRSDLEMTAESLEEILETETVEREDGGHGEESEESAESEVTTEMPLETDLEVPPETDVAEPESGEVDEEKESLRELGPPKVVVASDLHLLAKELMDGGASFMKKVESDDGKATAYSGEIVDAFLEEVIRLEPDALILNGDLTFEGERLSHQRLAEKLEKVQASGIQVLAIPGNHDINNPRAAAYLDDGVEEQESGGGECRGAEVPEVVKDKVDSIGAAEFAQIYGAYGYDQAVSRDEFSLSYLYPLRDDIWIMMLDTNQYEPENLVGGEIRPETYQWMMRELKRAEEAGAQVIPAGHHNLLSVSRMYVSECMINSRSSAIWLFGEYKIPLYLSGHLHVQRMKKNKVEPGTPGEAYGIHEIVTSSLGMAPHQYGLLTWEESGGIDYQVRQVDVEGWARSRESDDENLLRFGLYGREWFYRIVEKKIYGKLGEYPEEDKWTMARLYADILYHYGAGENVDEKEIKRSRAYGLWEWLLPDDVMMRDMELMMKDMR